jgi:hypothetical protein
MGMKGVTSAMVSARGSGEKVGLGFWVARTVESWLVEEEREVEAPAARNSSEVKSCLDGGGGGGGGVGAMPRAET